MIFLKKIDGSGITVANKGLPELSYREKKDKRSMLITLVRITSAMGDWGVFPVEQKQVKGW